MALLKCPDGPDTRQFAKRERSLNSRSRTAARDRLFNAKADRDARHGSLSLSCARARLLDTLDLNFIVGERASWRPLVSLIYALPLLQVTCINSMSVLARLARARVRACTHGRESLRCWRAATDLANIWACAPSLARSLALMLIQAAFPPCASTQ